MLAPQPLNETDMEQAADSLLGEHDFSAFRAAGCQASTPVREISGIRIIRDGPWISIDVTANAFLQHMVRNIAGLLVTIGQGEEGPDWAILSSISRETTKLSTNRGPGLPMTSTCMMMPAR